jgi:hypothetical protein
MEVAGANRRCRCQFRYRGSRRESAVAQLFSLGVFARMEISPILIYAGAVVGIAMCVFSAAFRAAARDFSNYDWRLLLIVFLVLFIMFWCLPIFFITDAHLPPVIILKGAYTTSLWPFSHIPLGNLGYWRELMLQFAFYSIIGSLLFTWLLHSFFTIYKRRQASQGRSEHPIQGTSTVYRAMRLALLVEAISCISVIWQPICMLFFFSGQSAPRIGDVFSVFFALLNFPAVLLTRGFGTFGTASVVAVMIVQSFIWTLVFVGLFWLFKYARLLFRRPDA